MNLPGWLKHWRRRNAAPTETDSGTALLNPATCVTTAELIELRRCARKLVLTRQQPARAQLAGNHASRFRGRGMDYQESRAYQAGDDIRNMDWRVTARAGRPHTKLFQEERERPVVHCIDLGPSLFFATRGALKSVIAARAATLLGWAAAAQGDRIGGLLFNGGHHELKPRSGHHGVLRLIHALVEQTDPRRGLTAQADPGGFNQALIRLRRIARPGSLVFLISDFRGLDPDTGNHLQHLRDHNDLVALQIVDPIEAAPPPPGLYGVTDGTRNGVLDTRSAADRSHYRAFFEQHQEVLETTMNRYRIPLLQLSTTDRVEEVLQLQFGKQRSAPARGTAAA